MVTQRRSFTEAANDSVVSNAWSVKWRTRRTYVLKQNVDVYAFEFHNVLIKVRNLVGLSEPFCLIYNKETRVVLFRQVAPLYHKADEILNIMRLRRNGVVCQNRANWLTF